MSNLPAVRAGKYTFQLAQPVLTGTVWQIYAARLWLRKAFCEFKINPVFPDKDRTDGASKHVVSKH